MSEQQIHGLREWRKRRFLTQVELADKVGVTAHTISAWETAVKLPRPGHIRDLAAALGIAPEQIDLPEVRAQRTPRPKELAA